MSVTQQNREIEIITPLGADVLLLRDLNVNEELGRLFTINLELNSTENIQFEDLLGQNVTIRLDRPGGQRFFNGYVGSISQTADQDAYAVYQATVHPWLWFLTRTSDCRIFQQITVPDIIKQVFRDLGFTDFEDKLNGNYSTWDYCVQYRETDFNFVSRLMEQEGIYYYFTHEQGKHTLNLADAYGSHEIIPDYEEIPYYPPDNVAVREEECISSWYISKQLQPGSYALNDYDFTRPKANLNTNSSVQREHSQSEYEVFDYPGDYRIASGKQRLSDDESNYVGIRIEELHTQYEQVQGQSIVRGLLCGGLFTLANYPRQDQNREYLVVSVNHSIQAESFAAGEGGGTTNYTNSFTVIDSNTPFRPARSSFKPSVQGPQTAVVVGPDGEEIYTDEHGRVKLQFHWDRYGESNENSSCWVRVSQVHAGKGFGGIDIPRIGEEVIVSFEEGDPDRPLVTGRVFNGDNKAPNGLPAQKMVSGMKTNSTPGGGGFNGVMLNDTKGKEGFTEHAQYNMDTTVENDQTNTVNNNRTTTIAVDDAESVGSNQKIDIGSNQDITVGSVQSTTVGSNRNLTVGANQSISVASDEDISIGSSQTNKVGSSRTTSIGTSDSLSVGGKQSISVTGPIEIASDAKITLSVAGSSIEISAGGIVLQSAAQITVQGSIIKLN